MAKSKEVVDRGEKRSDYDGGSNAAKLLIDVEQEDVTGACNRVSEANKA